MSDSQQFFRRDKKLWSAADRLRANLDAAVHKHAVLGLVVEMLEPYQGRVYDPAMRSGGFFAEPSL